MSSDETSSVIDFLLGNTVGATSFGSPPFESGGGGVPTSDEVDDGRACETGSAFAAHNVGMPSARWCVDVELTVGRGW